MIMKRNLLYIIMALVSVCAISCDRTATYQAITYVSFYNDVYTVDETVEQVVVPVILQNATGKEVQISVSVAESSTAEEGVDYEIISPELLTFEGDVDSLAVVVNIKSHVGEFTGTRSLEFELASHTDGVAFGVINTALININDLDHPLAHLFGTWSGVVQGNFQSPQYSTSFTIEPDPKDDTFTQVIISAGLEPFFVANGFAAATYVAVANEERNVISVKAGQAVGYQDVVLFGFDAALEEIGYDIDFELAGDGTLSNVNAYGSYTPSQGGFYEIYLPGGVFRKN